MLTQSWFAAVFALGAAAIIWMSWVFASSDLFALVITLAIGVAYLVGFLELRQFRNHTACLGASLTRARTQGVDDLAVWLETLPLSLQTPVRHRIEGEKVALPAPSLTPFITGLLVMLGLLGTFVGMVDTLKGAVVALEGSAELQAIREGLAAPIKGLGLAFGTSVAGVAGSALLGLAAALCRRERQQQVRILDGDIATVFRQFSLVYSQQQAFDNLQSQVDALPRVADKLAEVADKLDTMGDRLGGQLQNSQQDFHHSTQKVYTDLATEVGQALRESIAASGRLTGEAVTPVVKAVMDDISREIRSNVEQTHKQLTHTADQQLVAVTDQVNAGVRQLTENYEARSEQTLQAFEQSSTQLLTSVSGKSEALSQNLLGEITRLLLTSEQLVQARIEGEQQWAESSQQRLQQMANAVQEQLSGLRDEEQRRGDAAVARLGELQEAVTAHLSDLGRALEEPMSHLIETASETPKAAAEVIGHLRSEISKNIERDNSLLQERQKIMEELSALSASMEQASLAQNQAAELLVNSSTEMLEKVGERFSEQMQTEVGRINEVVDHFSGSAAELASLGESFGVAVNVFNDSSQALIDNLKGIEESLEKSNARSDEQLGYYVAQAREIIDHSMLSQKEVFEEIRKLSRAAEAEAV
ncbi:regulatory signaling modulator protein AmpE [Candidatus Pelagadaptatus aseana]|uniref:regulatory signaling modulator protein AmpE n=1 Tax=Candidatus Pelagadaptatus aseana TaxID=3120508 RepID=UPI003C6F2A5C